jgi:hypothetical protein
MPPAGHDAHGRPRLADRVAALRLTRFVGRRDQLALFASALDASPRPFSVLFVHGPGGVGKTTLLHAFARQAAGADRAVVWLDGRDIQPTGDAFGAAFEAARGSAVPATLDRAVVIVDTCEALAALDTWLRHTFLPQLPADVLVVLASRHRPGPGWRTDLAWAPLTRVMELHDFDAAETLAFLQSRGVAPSVHDEVLRFTHGHPLALTLVADAVHARGGTQAFEPGDAPHVVHQLLACLIDRLPPGISRDALDVAACARVTSEALLADVLGAEPAARAYRWLQDQPFVEHTGRGLFPHDVAREALLLEARWRDEARLRSLARRVYTAVHARMAGAHGPQRQQLQMDALYLTRTQPTHGPFFDWNAMDGRVDAAAAGDAAWIVDAVRRHEGEASAALAQAWWLAQPNAFHVFRDADDRRFGFLALLELTPAAVLPVAADPAAVAALQFVGGHGRPIAGDVVLYLRWWMHADLYQAVTAAINLTATHVVAECTTRPDVAWNFVAMADPQFWVPHFAGVNFARVPAADFDVGGRRFGVFAHDWRFEPAAAWLSGERTPMPFASPSLHPASQALDRAAFGEAVRRALRDYARPDALARSPLVAARCIRGAAAGDAGEALPRVLREAAEVLKRHPRDLKLYRAVWHTYFEPLATQEQVAERLGLPFSTYRRHLRQAIDRIAEALWQREQKASSFRSST